MKESALAEPSTAFLLSARCCFASFAVAGGLTGAGRSLVCGGRESGDFPVAFWGSHGDADSTVPIANGRSARDEFVAQNGYNTTTAPAEPSDCVTYQGCRAGYPVTWCEFSGGHTTPSFAGEALWDFFSQF